MTGPAYAPQPNDATGEEMTGSASDSLLARLSSSPAPSGMPLSMSEIEFDESNDTSSDYFYDEHLIRVVNITSFTFYGFIITIGLIGNLIVIFSILRTYRRISFTSMMLCSLAVADLLFTAVFIPIQLYTSYHSSWGFGFFGCYLMAFLWFLGPASSAMMLLVISAERYIVIIHPLQAKVFLTKKMGLIIVNVTWLIAILLSLVSIPFTTYMQYDVEGETFNHCNRQTSTYTGKVLKIFFFVGVLYALPLFGMFFCNIRVIITLHRSSRVTRTMQSINLSKSSCTNNGVRRTTSYSAARPSCGMESEISTVVSHGGMSNGATGDAASNLKGGGKRKSRMHSTLQERKRVMVLLGILVVTYAVLWGPLMVLLILGLHVEIDDTVNSLLSIAFHLLAMSNSAFNPLVYALMSRSFRKIIKNAFTLCCSRMPSPRLQLRNYRFTSTRDRGSSLSSTQMTQFSMRSINNADSLKRSNGANPHGYIYLRNNNVH
ncbi:beta-3 adrenergic receptor-like [Lytechinus pictus]|uniref:beta-3 adrenergic receptor-like n=1 Tax=Lytechinus pictus TaxID=7653 RepID=UPI0030B9BE39